MRRRPWSGLLLCFALLALLALSFMFGAPSYGLFFGLPGMNQLNTPFRWVYALTAAVAAMAGIGLHLLSESGRGALARRMGWGSLWTGLMFAAGCAVTYLAFDRFEPLFSRIVADMAHAAGAFADGRMFFSYQLPQVMTLALLLLVSGRRFSVGGEASLGEVADAGIAAGRGRCLGGVLRFQPGQRSGAAAFHAARGRVSSGAGWSFPRHQPTAPGRPTHPQSQCRYGLRLGRRARL